MTVRDHQRIFGIYYKKGGIMKEKADAKLIAEKAKSYSEQGFN